MLLYIVLACLNGMVVGTSRAINGGLSTDVGPLRASLWNHIVGFSLLTLILLTLGAWQLMAVLRRPCRHISADSSARCSLP